MIERTLRTGISYGGALGIPLRLLILEDNLSDAELMLYQLRRAGYDPDWQRVDIEKDFQAALSSDIQLILADYRLPQFDAGLALGLLRKSALDIPFIVVTGSISEEVAVEMMRQGASDYLLKDRLARLGQAVARVLGEHGVRQAKQETENALRESEARFRRLADNAEDVIYRYSLFPIQGLEYVSPAITAETGYTPEEFYVQPEVIFKLFYPEDHVLLSSNASSPLEIRMVRKDGQIIWTEQRFVLLHDGEGRLAAVEGISRDITDRKQRESELEAMAAMNTALRLAQSPAQLEPVILEQLSRVMKADAASIKYNRSNSDPEPAERGVGLWDQLQKNQLPPDHRLINQMASNCQPYLNNDLAGDVEQFPSARYGKCTAMAGVPLLSEGKYIGSVWLARKAPFTPADMHLFNSVSDVIAIAVHRANLHEQTMLQLQYLGALRQIDLAIASSLDLRVALNILLDQVLAQLGVDAADVMLFNPSTQVLEFAAGRGFRSLNIETTRVRIGEGYAGRAVMERRVVYIPEMGRTGDRIGQSLRLANEGFTSYYGVPLIASGTVKGVLEIFHRTPLHASRSQSWLDFLESLSRQAALAIDKAELFSELKRSNYELALAYDATIEGWSKALELRSQETEGHTQRVTEITMRLGRAFNMSNEELVQVRRGALLHDIGKISIPDAILQKPGPLTDEEWKIMRRHPGYAYELLKPIEYLSQALEIPYCHHEKWDGSGYPRGLAGNQILLEARIFAIVDVWDALLSDRPYRKAWSKEKTLNYLKEQSGIHFDPEVLKKTLPLLMEY
jgi:PAS domain S-box-containing protein